MNVYCGRPPLRIDARALNGYYHAVRIPNYIALSRWRDRRELNPHHQYGKLEYSPLYYYPIWWAAGDLNPDLTD